MFTEKTYINPKIEIKYSPIAGSGMFAKEDIAELRLHKREFIKNNKY